MKNLLVSMIVACLSGTAFSKSYLCITQAAGGVSTKNGKTYGTAIQGGQKYLLKKDEWFEFGQKVSMASCKPSSSPLGGKELTCQDRYRIHSVKFNQEELRFIYYYEGGYIRGFEDSDTPSIEVGTCSQLD